MCGVQIVLRYKCAYSHVNERRTDPNVQLGIFLLFFIIISVPIHIIPTYYTLLFFLSRWFHNTAVAGGRRNEKTI